MAYKFYYSGPLVYHTEINENDLNSLKKICLKDKKKDYRKNLAGHLNHEYLIDKDIFDQIITKYLIEYQEAFINWYNKKIINFETLTAWVNFMQPGDYNPPHIHSSDLSCVLYLDVPLKLKEENEKFVGTHFGPGAISFIFNCGSETLNINNKFHFPKTGDFFIFPANLLHSVAPFKSKVERISISANFNIKTS